MRRRIKIAWNHFIYLITRLDPVSKGNELGVVIRLPISKFRDLPSVLNNILGRLFKDFRHFSRFRRHFEIRRCFRFPDFLSSKTKLNAMPYRSHPQQEKKRIHLLPTALAR